MVALHNLTDSKNGWYPVYRLKDIKDDPFIEEWLVLGPFVMETGGAFEKEYLYEREKILNVDYLEDVGGEAAIRPYEGLRCPNRFFGPDTFTWEKVQTVQNRLLFEDITGEALYHTIQRNAVWYAAFYLECEKETGAFLRFDHSGTRIFVNGEMVFDQPYGRTKGLSTGGSSVLVNLKKGLNLIMAKVRPGFIADGIDFEISNFRITPVALNIKGISISLPEKSELFFGPVSAPRQVFTVLAGSLEGKASPCFIGLKELNTGYDQSIEVKDLKPCDVHIIRLGLPAGDTRRSALVKLYVKDDAEEVAAEFELAIDAFTGAQGQEFVFTEFHFDTTYHEEQRVYAFGAFDICRNYMQQFRKDPNFKGILSEVDYLHPYYSVFVEDRKLLKEVFMEGRAEPDCFYNQPNEMSVSGEGLVRNLVYGQLYHENVLGRRCIIYSPGDVFGHPAQLSQLAAKGGCTGLAWDKYILGLPPLFRHVSPDGSALVHRRGRMTRQEAHVMGFSSSMGTADRGAPSDWLKQLVPAKKLAVPSEFHEAILKEEKTIIESRKGKKPVPLTSRDISLYHAGTALSRIDLKMANRLGESLLISAEKFATIASLLGANYPERALDKAWRQLLCGQHHDSITGTHNEISYVDLMIAYRESVDIASEILNRAVGFLSDAIEVKCDKDEIPIHVYNPHSWERKEVCFLDLNLSKELSGYELRDINGQKCEMQLVSEDIKGDKYHYCVAFLAKVPALGYTTYYLTPGEDTIDRTLQSNDECTIENEYYRIQVDPDQGGGIISIYDKEEGRETLDTSKDGPGNRICVMKEYPDRNEAQHEFYTTGLKAYSSEYKAKVSVEKGPVMDKIIVQGRIGVICEIRQEIILFKGVKRIDFKTFIIDYQDEDDLFAVTFPSNLKGAVPTFDERYASVVKTKSKGKLDFRTHQMFMFSGCAVYPANRWIDYGPSVKFIIQDGGQTVSEHSIGMVALIRPEEPEMMEAADKLLIALTKKGLHVTQWPDGEQVQIGSLIKHFNEDLLNTDTRIVLTTAGLENKYAAELIGRLPEQEREQFLAAVEENGSSTLFMVDRDNLWGKPIDVVVIAGASIDQLQKRLDRMESELASNETVILNDCIFKAEKGIVDNYGISLINTGNIACSVEQGGLLTLMLFHTAKWYGGTGNITEEYFVPEQKTHVFRYSLYPHAGTWRDAKTYQKGFEVNDPLIAVQGNKKINAGILPECKSFLQTSDDIVITAMKAYGNPMASFQKNIGNVADRGITIRFYEPRGKTAVGYLKFGFNVDKVARANLLEKKESESRVDGNEIEWPVGPFTVETIYVHPQVADKKMPARDLGPWKEPVEPVFVRSWEHDAGTMPFGYHTVVASISRQVDVYPDEQDIGLTLNVVNNYIDSQVSGKLELIVPDGWEASENEFKYSLAAQDYTSFKIKVRKPSVAAQGQVCLLYEHEGQVFEDILEIGGAINLEFTMKRTEQGIVGIVKNTSKEPIEGELAIASPIETWPRGSVGAFSLVDIYPRTCKVFVPAGETKEFLFEVNPHAAEVHASWWAVGKLMVNGRIYMKAVKEPGINRKWRARTMRNIIEAENGTLVPYLNLMLL